MTTKIIKQVVNIDTRNPMIKLNAIIKSYDMTDTQFELRVISEVPLNFSGASVKVVIKYYVDTKGHTCETLAEISEEKITFALPTNLKGYDGYAVIGVYVDLADGSKIDIKDLVVKCEPSIIDKAAVDAQPYYFSNLDSVLIEFKQYASSKADELDNDVVSAKQEIADKVASVDNRLAIETITSKVADVDSHATTTKSDMDTRLADVNSYATDTLTDVNNVSTKAKSDIANLVANAQTNADTASQQVNDYATSTKADMDTAKTSIDDYAITQKSTIDKTVADVNTHATTQKQVINSVVSDVQSTGDTAKAEIKAALPTLQGEVSELSESVTELKGDLSDLPIHKYSLCEKYKHKKINGTDIVNGEEGDFLVVSYPDNEKSHTLVKNLRSDLNGIIYKISGQVSVLRVSNGDNIFSNKDVEKFVFQGNDTSGDIDCYDVSNYDNEAEWFLEDTSVFVEPTRTKNLFDYKKAIIGFVGRVGYYVKSDHNFATGILPLDGATELYSNFRCSYVFVDSNGDAFLMAKAEANAKTEVPINAKYFCISSNNSTGFSITKEWLKSLMVSNDKFADFEPYYTYSKNDESNQFVSSKFIFDGDSLTDNGSGSIYWKATCKELNIRKTQVTAVGGTAMEVQGNETVGKESICTDARVNKYDLDADYICLMCGTNGGGNLGELSLQNSDISTFIGAFNVWLSKVYYKYRLSDGHYSDIDYSGIARSDNMRDVKIILITPPQAYGSSNPEDISEKLKKRGDAMLEMSRFWGIPCVDSMKSMQMNIFNCANFYGDGTHFSDRSHIMLAYELIDEIRKIKPIDFGTISRVNAIYPFG